MKEQGKSNTEPAAQDRSYNGWANYPTWAVNLWLSNEENIYHASRGVLADAGNPHRGAADLQEWVEGSNPILGEASMYSDLLGWALQIVYWDAVARSLGPDEWEESAAPDAS